jgi:hypothetical protein
MIVSINQDRAYINQGNNELTAINKLSQNIKWRFQDETFTIFQPYQVGWELNVNTSSGSQSATITSVQSETQATVQFSNNTTQQVQNTSFGTNWTFIAPFSASQLPEQVSIQWFGSGLFSPVTGEDLINPNLPTTLYRLSGTTYKNPDASINARLSYIMSTNPAEIGNETYYSGERVHFPRFKWFIYIPNHNQDSVNSLAVLTKKISSGITQEADMNGDYALYFWAESRIDPTNNTIMPPMMHLPNNNAHETVATVTSETTYPPQTPWGTKSGEFISHGWKETKNYTIETPRVYFNNDRGENYAPFYRWRGETPITTALMDEMKNNGHWWNKGGWHIPNLKVLWNFQSWFNEDAKVDSYSYCPIALEIDGGLMQNEPISQGQYLIQIKGFDAHFVGGYGETVDVGTYRVNRISNQDILLDTMAQHIHAFTVEDSDGLLYVPNIRTQSLQPEINFNDQGIQVKTYEGEEYSQWVYVETKYKVWHKTTGAEIETDAHNHQQWGYIYEDFSISN